MAIKERVVLIDEYSSKAKKITESTTAMGKAMDKIKGTASSMESALKSAFNRSYKVDIKDIGSKSLESRVEGLKKSLDGLNKPYEVTITAKENRFDKVKTNLSKVKANLSSIKNTAKSIKKPLDSAFTSAKKFKMDVSSLRAARKEAKQIGKEISAFTGKRHKVHIDMENPIKSAFKGGFNKMAGGLKSGLSKLNPFKRFGGGSPASEDGGGIPNITKSIVGGNLITGAITKGIGVVSNIASSTIGAGFNRLTSIEAAQARLRGFGYNQKQVGNVTKSATEAVTGTQYSLGDAMAASASAIAAGVKETELTDYLKEVGNAAAATGSDFNDIASIMNKVKTTGRLQADEMMQLSDRGLPVLAKLAENAGISANEMRERISKGLVSFDEFRAAVKDASGSASEEMAKTWTGAKDNLKSALSKLGAGLLGGNEKENGEQGGIFGAMTPMLLKVNDALNGLVPKFKDLGDKVADFASNGFKKLKAGFGKVGEFMKPAVDKFKQGFENLSTKLGEIVEPLKEKFATAFEGLKKAFAPLKEAFSNFLGEGTENSFSILNTAIDIVAGGLSMLADVITFLSPYIQSLADIIATYVLPVIQTVADFITGTLIPGIVTVVSILVDTLAPIISGIASFLMDNVLPVVSTVIQGIAEFVTGSLLPAFSNLVEFLMGTVVPIIQGVIEAISDFINGVIMPVLQAVADLISGAVTAAFDAVKSAVEWAVDAFNSLISAVSDAADALFDLPGKIAGWVGDKVGGAINKAKSYLGIGQNATGTEYFEGGLTGINERGSEMIQLARGSKIYPADKTNKIIKKEVTNNSRSVDRSTDSTSIVINVNGANMTNKDVGRAIGDELKRLGVVV